MPWMTRLVVCVLALAAPVDAWCCAICGCGDPTLTVTGAEAPLAGRVRVGAEARVLEDRWAGPAGGTTTMRDARTTFVASWAPIRPLLLSISVPFAFRDVVLPNLATAQSLGAGDVDLRARLFVAQDRSFRPRHALSIHAGVLLPTALALMRPSLGWPPRRPAVNKVDEAVPGLMAVMPLLGAQYVAHPHAKVTAVVQATLLVPVAFTTDTRVGPMANVGGALQWQPHVRGAVRGLLDARVTPHVRHGTTGVDKNSGGTVVFAGTEVVLSPWTDTLINASVRVPVFNALHGVQQVGPVLAVGVVRDLS